VAKCRAAHSFAVEVVGLFNNQSSRANGGERSPRPTMNRCRIPSSNCARSCTCRFQGPGNLQPLGKRALG
jgi:hypothetical protein